jgi:hypothetical protein
MRGSEFAVQINHSAARFGHGLAFDDHFAVLNSVLADEK